ncbi:MAG: PLP-dependent aminotransferase family protein [Candidatus Cloacimonetes bacterium]|nr:PLP-dependent aminotransferase family protein [Candidatus Cloacimonadota bacterium]
MRDIKSAFTQSTLNMKSSMIRELVASTKGIPGLISFAGGFPSPKTFPVQELAELFQAVIESDGADILQYGASEGDVQLKAAIKKLEKIDIHDDEMLITVGSTNAIFYMTKVFIEPGEIIYTEAPSFLGSLVTFEALGADVRGIPLDKEGISCKHLTEEISRAKKEGKIGKFIYVIPEFQNPSGLTMSLKRRKELLEIVKENDLIILEDSPYEQLRYSGKKETSLFELARKIYNDDQLVVSVKSFSKILGPGLRIAYAMGNKDIIRMMGSWNQKVNVTPDCVAERVVARFIDSGMIYPHIEKIRSFYKPLRDAMLKNLKKHMPKEVKWTQPDGGMFIWITLPEYMDALELFEKAKAYKVAFIPGLKFYPEESIQNNTLRLNFSYPTIEQIETGVERLGELIRDMLK